MILVGNDNDVTLQNYQLAATGAPVTDAQPSFTVYGFGGEDSQGNAIVGAALSGLSSVAMSYVLGSSGNYRGLIPGTASLIAGTQYYIVVAFSNYNDTFADWFTAAVRTSSTG
jgi:hypothetical protein